MERGKRTLYYCDNLSLLWLCLLIDVNNQEEVRVRIVHTLYSFVTFITFTPLIPWLAQFHFHLALDFSHSQLQCTIHLKVTRLGGFTCTTFFGSFQVIQQPSLIADSSGLYLITFVAFSFSGFHQIIVYYPVLCTLNLEQLFFCHCSLKVQVQAMWWVEAW